MKFSIGDKILLKQTDEEGVVTGIICHDMFEVSVNGVVFPVHKDDIDHPYLKWFTQKKSQSAPVIPEVWPVEKNMPQHPRLSKGVYLSFMPMYKKDVFEDIVEGFKLYLINEMPTDIQIHYDAKILQQSVFSYKGKLHGFAHLYLHNISLEEMNDQPRFHWKLSDAGKEQLRSEEGILKIRPQKLFEQIQEILQKNEPTFQYLLVTDFKEKIPEASPKNPPKSPLPIIKRHAAKSFRTDELPRTVLDLHIEQLVKDATGWSHAEIITLQIQTLQRYLALALLHHLPRMIVIHGVGKGKLKDEVHKVLRQVPEIKSFTNEWMGGYGFGATEIHFKQ